MLRTLRPLIAALIVAALGFAFGYWDASRRFDVEPLRECLSAIEECPYDHVRIDVGGCAWCEPMGWHELD